MNKTIRYFAKTLFVTLDLNVIMSWKKFFTILILIYISIEKGLCIPCPLTDIIEKITDPKHYNKWISPPNQCKYKVHFSNEFFHFLFSANPN